MSVQLSGWPVNLLCFVFVFFFFFLVLLYWEQFLSSCWCRLPIIPLLSSIERCTFCQCRYNLYVTPKDLWELDGGPSSEKTEAGDPQAFALVSKSPDYFSCFQMPSHQLNKNICFQFCSALPRLKLFIWPNFHRKWPSKDTQLESVEFLQPQFFLPRLQNFLQQILLSPCFHYNVWIKNGRWRILH